MAAGVMSIRFSDGERAICEEAAKKEGTTPSALLRRVFRDWAVAEGYEFPEEAGAVEPRAPAGTHGPTLAQQLAELRAEVGDLRAKVESRG